MKGYKCVSHNCLIIIVHNKMMQISIDIPSNLDSV